MKTILAPIDFSEITGAVVAQAATLARAINARVVLYTVVQPPAVVSEYAVLWENIGELTTAGEETAARHLAGYVAKLQAESISAESAHAVGSPIPLIAEQAEKCCADYIVMGSHGHTALYDLLVGSTTHGILMRARCPVVIVPAINETKTARRKTEQRATLV